MEDHLAQNAYGATTLHLLLSLEADALAPNP